MVHIYPLPLWLKGPSSSVLWYPIHYKLICVFIFLHFEVLISLQCAFSHFYVPLKGISYYWMFFQPPHRVHRLTTCYSNLKCQSSLGASPSAYTNLFLCLGLTKSVWISITQQVLGNKPGTCNPQFNALVHFYKLFFFS